MNIERTTLVGILILFIISCSIKDEKKDQDGYLFLDNKTVCSPKEISSVIYYQERFAKKYVEQFYQQWYPEDITASILKKDDCYLIEEDGSIRTPIVISFTTGKKLCLIEIRGNLILHNSKKVEFSKVQLSNADCLGISKVHKKSSDLMNVTFNFANGLYYYVGISQNKKNYFNSNFDKLQFNKKYYLLERKYTGKSNYFTLFPDGTLKYYYPSKSIYFNGTYKLIDNKIEILVNKKAVKRIDEPDSYFNPLNRVAETISLVRRFDISNSEKEKYGKYYGDDLLYELLILNDRILCGYGFALTSKGILYNINRNYSKKNSIGRFNFSIDAKIPNYLIDCNDYSLSDCDL